MLSELTPGQRAVALHLAEGSQNKVFAHKIGTTEATVKVHVKAILRALGVSNRTEAAIVLREGKKQPVPSLLSEKTMTSEEKLKACPACGGEYDQEMGATIHADRCISYTRQPTPAAEDMVEAVARSIQDVHAPGHPINHVSIYQARAAIAALKSRSAEPVDNDRVSRWRKASAALGSWLSAAYDDPDVCDAMKADIREWFSAGEPFESMAAEPAGEDLVAYWYRKEGKFDTIMLAAYGQEARNEMASQGYSETPLYADPTPSNPDRLVEAITLADIKEIAAAATQTACETDPADPDHPNTLYLTADEFEAIVRCTVENWLERKALSAAPVKDGGEEG